MLGLVLHIAIQVVAAFYRNFNTLFENGCTSCYSLISVTLTFPADGLFCACPIALHDQS